MWDIGGFIKNNLPRPAPKLADNFSEGWQKKGPEAKQNIMTQCVRLPCSCAQLF